MARHGRYFIFGYLGVFLPAWLLWAVVKREGHRKADGLGTMRDWVGLCCDVLFCAGLCCCIVLCCVVVKDKSTRDGTHQGWGRQQTGVSMFGHVGYLFICWAMLGMS